MEFDHPQSMNLQSPNILPMQTYYEPQKESRKRAVWYGNAKRMTLEILQPYN